MDFFLMNPHIVNKLLGIGYNLVDTHRAGCKLMNNLEIRFLDLFIKFHHSFDRVSYLALTRFLS